LTRLFLSSLFVGAMAVSALAQGFGVSFNGLSQNTEEPVEVAAERLTVDQDNGDAIFTGDVVIGQGDMRMAAQEVKVFYTEEGGVSRMFATGGVTLVTAEEEMEAAEVEYLLDDDIMVLSGNVLFVQGRTSLSADRMRIDIATNSGVLEGRVRSVIQPEDN